MKLETTMRLIYALILLTTWFAIQRQYIKGWSVCDFMKNRTMPRNIFMANVDSGDLEQPLCYGDGRRISKDKRIVARKQKWKGRKVIPVRGQVVADQKLSCLNILEQAA